MALSDFFRINLPYGLKKNSKGEWFAFNREYLPLGWNSYNLHNRQSIYGDNAYAEYPVYTKYEGLTEKAILRIITIPKNIQRNKAGEIEIIFFYDDGTNPQSNPEYWDDYFKIIKAFSKFLKEI
jgi:hypothetical protein